MGYFISTCCHGNGSINPSGAQLITYFIVFFYDHKNGKLCVTGATGERERERPLLTLFLYLARPRCLCSPRVEGRRSDTEQLPSAHRSWCGPAKVCLRALRVCVRMCVCLCPLSVASCLPWFVHARFFSAWLCVCVSVPLRVSWCVCLPACMCV